MTEQQHLEPLGDPDDTFDPAGDFAGEHDDTSVDDAVQNGEAGEAESPRGWDGMDGDGPP